MVEPAHHRLSTLAQCCLLRISRAFHYPETEETLAPMTIIDIFGERSGEREGEYRQNQ